jgi:hypothetical protein
MSGFLTRVTINHEETKIAKKDQKILRVLRFFVVDSLRSLHVALRRPETMKIGGEGSATYRGCAAFSSRHMPKPRNLGRLPYFVLRR